MNNGFENLRLAEELTKSTLNDQHDSKESN